MTYTSHGHHIPGTPWDEETGPGIIRCGGVKLCRECKLEAVRILPKDSAAAVDLTKDLFPIIPKVEHPSGLPIDWVRQPIRNHEVIHFDSVEKAPAIQEWLTNYTVESAFWPGFEGRMPRVEYIEGPTPLSICKPRTVLLRQYLVRLEDLRWTGKLDDANEKIFEYVSSFRAFEEEQYKEQFEPSSMIAPVPLSWMNQN